ncbi:unnamed protein product [Lupinus luteus]|uniref:Uncharacterized protein n=1 Tax=Lupinus luteus TaxID=3873 RepID=A0AAV1Y1B6_LUPLU
MPLRLMRIISRRKYFQIGVDLLQKGFERISIMEVELTRIAQEYIYVASTNIQLKSGKIQISQFVIQKILGPKEDQKWLQDFFLERKWVKFNHKLEYGHVVCVMKKVTI